MRSLFEDVCRYLPRVNPSNEFDAQLERHDDHHRARSQLIEALRKAAAAASPDGTVHVHSCALGRFANRYYLCLRMSQQVIVLYTNNGFSELAHNALCSLQQHALLKRTILLVNDAAACSRRMSAKSSPEPQAFTAAALCVVLPIEPRAKASPRQRGGRSSQDSADSLRDASRWGSEAYR